MQRAIFSSREELEAVIAQAENISISPLSRSITLPVKYSNSEEQFVSLIEANRREVMASLTPEQIAELENDEEEYEFEPTDSVICDVTFALLLNANRELQIADTIYKYYSNGVLRTLNHNLDSLKYIENKIDKIIVTPENEGTTLSLGSGTDFTLLQYRRKFDPNDNSIVGDQTGPINGGNSDEKEPNIGLSTSTGITLSNGTTIPNSNIRDVDFEKWNSGDGNWMHKILPKITKGFSVNAINQFDDGKKLTMTLYHYNYIVYSKIGVKLKFQKKRFFIWWNVKAEEMVLGWEALCVKEEFGLKPGQILPDKYDAIPKTEHYALNILPNNVSEILFHIPFINYDFTNRNINKAFNKGLETAVKYATEELKRFINDPNTPKRQSLFTHKDRDLYTFVHPNSFGAFDKRSIDYTFYDKGFSNAFQIGIASNGQSARPIFKIDINDHLDIYYCQVFGAIRHKGKWLAGRITKIPNKQ